MGGRCPPWKRGAPLEFRCRIGFPRSPPAIQVSTARQLGLSSLSGIASSPQGLLELNRLGCSWPVPPVRLFIGRRALCVCLPQDQVESTQAIKQHLDMKKDAQ
eukprot:7219757-Alexandrium_andersonii.AAC.1